MWMTCKHRHWLQTSRRPLKCSHPICPPLGPSLPGAPVRGLSRHASVQTTGVARVSSTQEPMLTFAPACPQAIAKWEEAADRRGQKQRWRNRKCRQGTEYPPEGPAGAWGYAPLVLGHCRSRTPRASAGSRRFSWQRRLVPHFNRAAKSQARQAPPGHPPPPARPKGQPYSRQPRGRAGAGPAGRWGGSPCSPGPVAAGVCRRLGRGGGPTSWRSLPAPGSPPRALSGDGAVSRHLPLRLLSLRRAGSAGLTVGRWRPVGPGATRGCPQAGGVERATLRLGLRTSSWCSYVSRLRPSAQRRPAAQLPRAACAARARCPPASPEGAAQPPPPPAARSRGLPPPSQGAGLT